MNKAFVTGNISDRMIVFCDDSVALLLTIIYNYIINTEIYPSVWKSSNVTLLQFIKDCKPISSVVTQISLNMSLNMSDRGVESLLMGFKNTKANFF